MRCWIQLVLLSACLIGCERAETDEERLKRFVPNALSTTKVSGNVTVDGAPVKDLTVTLHPSEATVRSRTPGDPNSQLLPRAQTDAEGKFRITTYNGGDGAPKGEYNITIEWLTYIKRSSDWGGPDKLKNQYNDPKTTPFHVTVEDQPLVLPAFELKVAGVEGKAAPTKPPENKREK